MSKLTQCLLDARLDQNQAKQLRLIAKEYRDNGKTVEQAELLAAEDLLNDLREERDDIVSQIKAKGGVIEGEEPEAPALDLTAQTEASRRAEEEETRRRTFEAAQAAKAIADKAEADRAREGFGLTGSDSEADQAAAAGQKPMFSKTAVAGAAESRTVATARAEMVKEFGQDAVDTLERNGILKIMLWDDLPQRQKDAAVDGVDGMYDQSTQTAYIIADRMAKGSIKRLLLHEIGEHHGLPSMLGAEGHNRLLNDVRRMIADSKDAKFVDALKHVRANYPELAESDNNFAREVIARYAENPGDAPWWKRLLSEVRQFLFRNGFTKELSEDDLSFIVQKALRKTMRGEIVKYDKQGNSILKIGDDNDEGTAGKAMGTDGDALTIEAARAYLDTLRIPAAGLERIRAERAVRSIGSLGHASRLMASGQLGQLEGRAGFCYPYAAGATHSGLGDMVIGEEGPPWDRFGHAVVKATDGAIYDPTLGWWFEPGVYEEVHGFVPGRTFTSDQVVEYTAKHGELPSAEKLGIAKDSHTPPRIMKSQRLSADDQRERDDLVEALREADGNDDARGTGRVSDELIDARNALEEFDQAHGIDSDEDGNIVSNVLEKTVTERDILASKGAAATPPAGLPDETKPQHLARLFTDSFNRWGNLQEYLEAKVPGVITWDKNVHNEERRFHGKVEADSKLVQRRFIMPIEKIAKAEKIPLELFDKFNRARHAPERNAAIAKIDPNKQDGGAGMLDENTAATTANANKFIADLTGREREALTRMNDLLVEMNRWRLGRQLESGTITQGEHDVLTKKYRHYVPLKTIPDDAVDGTGATGYALRGKEYQRALGRASLADSPLLVSIMDVSRSIIRTRKTEVGNAVYKLAETEAAKQYLEVLDPENMHKDFFEKKPYKVTAKDENGRTITREEVRYGIKSSYPNAKNVFPVKVGGVQKYVLIKDDLLAEQIKKLGDAELGPFLEKLNYATGLLGRMFTQYNPAFVMINHIRDMLTVAINSRGIPGMSPGRVLAGTYESYPTIYSYYFGDGTHDGVKGYEEFLEAGASIGGLGLKTKERLAKEMQQRGIGLKTADDPSVVQRAVGNFKNLAEFVSKLNEVVENATRFSVYRHAKEVFLAQNLAKGMPQKDAEADATQRAAVLAREISVDFNKHGEVSRALNSMYVFFNAAVQGLRSFYKFTATGPQRARVAQALFGIMAAGAMARIFNQLAGGWDDDLAEPNALKVEQSADMNAPIIIEPLDKVIRFPLPYVYNIPFAIGYRAMDIWFTGRVAHNLAHMGRAAYSAISPLGEPQAANSPVGWATKTFTPSLLTPVANILDNSDRYARPIAPQPMSWDKGAPPRAQLYWSSATTAGKAVASFLNVIGGGDEVKPGAFDVSPDWVDHVTSYYLGGVGRTLMQGYDLVAKGMDPLKDVTAADIPVGSRLVAELHPEYYNSIKYREVEKELAYVDDYRKAKQGNKVTPAQAVAYPIYKSTESQLKIIQKRLTAARDKKDEALELQLEERVRGLKGRVVRAYNMADGKYLEAMNGASREEAAAAARAAGKTATAGLFESQ